MATDLINRFPLEQNNKLTKYGYFVYCLIILTCLVTLLYPLMEDYFNIHLKCIFYKITGVPCPTCGYSRAVQNFVSGNLKISILFNPLWIILIVYQIGLIIISIKSIIHKRVLFINTVMVYLFMGLMVLNWIIKLYIGNQFY